MVLISLSKHTAMYRVISLFSVLLIAAATIDTGKNPGEVYWNNVLPNTPMPSAIKELIMPDEYDVEKVGTAVTVGKGGVIVNTGKGTNVNVGHGGVGVHTPKGTNVNVGHGNVGVHTGKGTNVNVGHGGVGVHTPKGTNVNVGHGNVGVHTGKGTNVNVGHGHVTVVPKGRKPGGTTVNVGKGGVVVNAPHKKKPVNVNVGKSFNYEYAATDTQIQTDPNIALFFLEKDLKPGNKMTLHFTQTTTPSFISRDKANSIPFTSAKLPSIVKHFSIQPDSVEAESMKETLLECEAPAMAGERRVCATSLESMVDFTTSNLGTRNVLAVSTTVSKEHSPKQQYEIVSVKRFPESNMVVCHAQTYAYAVFYCHTTKGTKAYEITMNGNDGTKVEAVAVCHTDTAGWNPKHIAFKKLGVKPGTVPVCHFLPHGHIVWTRKV